MISTFKDSIYGLLIKILLGLVAFSLVFWGIGTNSPHRDDYVAKIDQNHFIYKDKFNQQRQNLVRSIVTMNPGISLDHLDVDSLVLNSMIQNKILEIELEKLGIFVSDEMAKNEIKKNKFFFDKNNHFDHNLFKRIIINQGMTEKEYIFQQKLAVATQILNSAVIPFSAPDSMIRDLYQYYNQSRKLNIIYIKPKLDNNSALPSNEDIKKYYESHQQDFTTTEMRDIEYIVISTKHTANTEKHLAMSSQEKLMHNILKEIEDDIAAGESLEKIAKKYKVDYFKINKLSSLSKEIKYIKPEDTLKFISLAFESGSENLPSETMQLSPESNDYYIFNTKTIYPSKTLTLDQVKNDIIRILNSQNKKEILKRNAGSIYRQYVINNNKNEFIKNNKDAVRQDTITISRNSPKMQAELMRESFNLNAIGSYTNLIQESDNSFVFAILEQVIIPPATTIPVKVAAELKDSIDNALDTAIHNELMRDFYNKHTIQVKKIQNTEEPQA